MEPFITDTELQMFYLCSKIRSVMMPQNNFLQNAKMFLCLETFLSGISRQFVLSQIEPSDYFLQLK